MSKLIVEMEMPQNCKKCPLVHTDHFGQIRCGGQSGRLIHLKNFQTEIERPSWCPIKGEIIEIELMHLEEERAFAARDIAAERKDEALRKQLRESHDSYEQRIAELEAQLPKEGEWIDIDGTMFAECSVCGKRHYGCTTPYCDMCGARMTKRKYCDMQNGCVMCDIELCDGKEKDDE